MDLNAHFKVRGLARRISNVDFDCKFLGGCNNGGDLEANGILQCATRFLCLVGPNAFAVSKPQTD
jgi:hypothetical protein